MAATKQPFVALFNENKYLRISHKFLLQIACNTYNVGCNTSFELGTKKPLLNLSITVKNPLPAPLIAPHNTIII